MRKVTWMDRLRYQFDNTMSRGTAALIGWLVVLSALLITITSLIVVGARLSPIREDGSSPGFLETAWISLMRAMDSGALGGDSGSLAFMTMMLINTLGGIFLVSILIGVLTSGVEGKIEELRKGRSLVIEEGHTVILGWSPQIFSILSDLIEANSNQARSCVVVLAEKDKVEMEDEIRAKVGDTGRTHVVCRTGSPLELTDLEIVNPHYARSIIVLAPETGNPDAQVIKALLALTNNPHRRSTPYHIVAEVREAKNMEVAQMVGRKEAELVLVGDLISRITVQTCRQSGLSVIYQELLGFSGDEIYFRKEPGLIGKTFAEALFAYEDSAVMGLLKEDQVRLAPPLQSEITAGDQLIVIAKDDDAIRLSTSAAPPIEKDAIRVAQPRSAQPERTLILGWNQRVLSIIRELDRYVAPGSEVHIVAEGDEGADKIASESLRSQQVSFQSGDITDRHTLETLLQTPYDHIVVLSYSDLLSPQEADARTLITLLHLREIAARTNQTFSIVSEMMDVRNRQLAEVTEADDFIVSDTLVSHVLVQIAENKHLAAVFADLFDPAGAELYLKPAEDYVALGRPVNFYTVTEAARQRGEVAVGYRLEQAAGQSTLAYGVRVNPPKSQPITFAEGDRIIVLSEQ